ncbi:MAG: saccharopine dehydrogenase [Candidatus Syntrophonatronum acetioxidans]|uniref:Saccharopine dehydrogenase n=1 Tax=Candidatus Syntrophonatronum acetioxidans TaxID=1795816 RepID=A0A424YF38_9FIRM|nr:MAG: saccharopine dehydrogenase [Candidatus Syntrophonatronum acetioxidans]
MKIIFFGATGDMGQRAVKELCSFPEISQVTVVARSRARYEKLLEKTGEGKEKLKLLEADINRIEDPGSLMGGHDLVANAAGPFYKYEGRLAKGAAAAGVHYVSICDDSDAVEEVFKMEEEINKKGILVLTGVGWTPGLSSLLARAGADSLDKVDKINISWAGTSDDASGIAVILHTLHICEGRIPSFLEGSWQMIPAGSGREKVRFPQPVGEIYVYHVGHPEPLTMPRYFPGISQVTLKGGINEDLLNRLAILLGKMRISRKGLTRDMLAHLVQKMLPLLRRAAGAAPEESGIRVDLYGLSRGKKYGLTYSAAGPMDILTGVPLAVALREIARGKVKGTGVFAPEAPGLLDPQVFFQELEKKGVEIFKEKNEV